MDSSHALWGRAWNIRTGQVAGRSTPAGVREADGEMTPELWLRDKQEVPGTRREEGQHAASCRG